MILKTTERSTFLDLTKMAWEPSGFPGVWTKTLYEEPSGRRTTLTRFEPGATLPRHRHVGLEQSFVLEGSLVDDEGECTAGNFVIRAKGSRHAPKAPKGCTMLVFFLKPTAGLNQALLKHS